MPTVITRKRKRRSFYHATRTNSRCQVDSRINSQAKQSARWRGIGIAVQSSRWSSWKERTTQQGPRYKRQGPRRQLSTRDPLQEIELADAIEHQIRTLPHGCRRVARLLSTCSQLEISARTGLSKRKVAELISIIRSHFPKSSGMKSVLLESDRVPIA